MNRKNFIVTSATAGAALAGSLACGYAAADATRRKPPFRVLYSNDTTNILTCVSPYHKKGEPFTAERLQATVDEAAGVDAHLLQPGLGWIPWWKSKIYPATEHYRWFQDQTGLPPDSFGAYMLAGGDMVKVFIERCRAKGQAPFISMRLNDSHHLENAGTKTPGAIWCSKFYEAHLQDCITPGKKSADHVVLNWTVPEIREHKFAFIRELCENYGLDGFELDFLRRPSFFRMKETTSAQRREIMTAFVARVRELLDRTAKPGQRRWLCLRVPCLLQLHDRLGLDAAALTAAGADMINLSPYYYTVCASDMAAVRKLAPKAALYLEITHSTSLGPKIRPEYDGMLFRRTTNEQFFTAAHVAYARGGGGVSLFNFVYFREHGSEGRGPFNEPPFGILKRLGDREWLAKQPQHYFIGAAYEYSQPMPKRMARDTSATFALDAALPTGGWKRAGRLRIQIAAPMTGAVAAAVRGTAGGTAGGTTTGTTTRTTAGNRFSAKINDVSLEPTEDISEPYPNPYPPMLGTAKTLRAWRVPAALLRDGINTVAITMEAGEAADIVFLDLAMNSG